MRRRYLRWLWREVESAAVDSAADRIALWEFPPEDFAAWCELVGRPETRSYAEYLALLAAVQAEQERAGRTVARIHFGVARMREELIARGWPNTPEHRAAVTGLLAAQS